LSKHAIYYADSAKQESYVQNNFFRQKISSFSLTFLFAITAALLTACGAGTSDTPTSTSPSLTVTMTNGGVPVTSITSGTPATVHATLKDETGAAITGKVVTFSTDAALATITPAATALTDATGVATVTLSPASPTAAGATAVTAIAQVGTTALSGSLGYSVGTAVVTATAPSIQYVSSAPTNISLKGTGGNETSKVTFKVLDNGGNPLSGKTVNFKLDNTAGGITLTASTSTSNANGLVVATVNAGTVTTPVRVAASICADTTNPCTNILTVQSSQLTITTGIPDQFGFSLAATQWNIEGLSIDGVTTTLSVHLADHFKNPVPDDTAVVFTAEAGSVIGTCSTVAGACSVPYRSQGTRPFNGRVSILAYAVGEETFTDSNGNGWADLSPNEMIDPNGVPTDMPETFVDYNENGLRDAYDSVGTLEPFIDFNNDKIYNPADDKFSGILCDDVTAGRSSAGTCSPNKTIHVRQAGVIVLSGSTANITINKDAAIAIPACDDGTLPSTHTATGNAPKEFTITVVDANGNAMPAGTTVAFATDNGKISSLASYVVPSSLGCRSSTHTPVGGVPVADYPGCPIATGSATFGDYKVTLQSDAAFTPAVAGTSDASCSNTTPSGTFTVTVTTPSNTAAPTVTKTTATATVTD
jgi:hypothetical protein